MTTAYQTLESFLKSSGEGSHGGHIIGHTRSGAPIYERHGLFEAHHAQFNDHFIERVPDEMASVMSVPLGNGYHAENKICYDDDGGTEGAGENEWSVTGPDGKQTHHQLDESFYDKAADIIGHHQDYADETGLEVRHSGGAFR